MRETDRLHPATAESLNLTSFRSLEASGRSPVLVKKSEGVVRADFQPAPISFLCNPSPRPSVRDCATFRAGLWPTSCEIIPVANADPKCGPKVRLKGSPVRAIYGVDWVNM